MITHIMSTAAANEHHPPAAANRCPLRPMVLMLVWLRGAWGRGFILLSRSGALFAYARGLAVPAESAAISSILVSSHTSTYRQVQIQQAGTPTAGYASVIITV